MSAGARPSSGRASRAGYRSTPTGRSRRPSTAGRRFTHVSPRAAPGPADHAPGSVEPEHKNTCPTGDRQGADLRHRPHDADRLDDLARGGLTLGRTSHPTPGRKGGQEGPTDGALDLPPAQQTACGPWPGWPPGHHQDPSPNTPDPMSLRRRPHVRRCSPKCIWAGRAVYGTAADGGEPPPTQANGGQNGGRDALSGQLRSPGHSLHGSPAPRISSHVLSKTSSPRARPDRTAT
jgi:hypothetical protein